MGIQKLRINKKGLEFKLAFFAIIALSMFVVASGVVLTGWDSTSDQGVIYDSGIGNQYDLGEFDRLDQFSEEAEAQRVQVSPQDPDPGTGDFEGRTFRSVFSIITGVFTPFNIVFGEGGMIDSITDRFGVPNYVRIGLVTLMAFALIFAIIAVIFRLPRRSA